MATNNATAGIINQAAAIIAGYNPTLAAAFRATPWKREALALAFANGFAVDENGEYPRFVWVVIRAAMLDKQNRAAVSA